MAKWRQSVLTLFPELCLEVQRAAGEGPVELRGCRVLRAPLRQPPLALAGDGAVALPAGGDCLGLWEHRLSEADMAEARRLFAERRKPLHQEARQAMRGI
jgi:hypothetical protein